MIWILLAVLEGARAAEPGDVSVSLRVLAETWADEGIGQSYTTGALIGGAGAAVTVRPWLDVDLELGWRRLEARDGGDPVLQLMPISAMAEYAFGSETFRPYVGLGPALTLFSEYHPDGHDGPEAWTAAEADPTVPLRTVLTGGRICAEVRLGLRIDTGLVHEPLPPAQAGPIRAVEVEFYLGRRLQNPLRGEGEGFRLSAWRAGLGLAFRM